MDQVLRLDIPLEVGAASESVTVTDAPPALNTETATRGEVTTQDEIKEMPLDGRNFSDLALLTGGVIPKGDGGDGSYAVNGARADNTGFLLDGMNNTQRRNTGAVINPPIEGVQEFKMLTSGFSAEYGRYAGGMLTVVTKSGTNRLRGSLYEFLRNDVLDATGYFDPDKAKLRRNQFGATVSGPVYLPKLYDGRNRTFFMFTWDSLRLIDGRIAAGRRARRPRCCAAISPRRPTPSAGPSAITDTLNRGPVPEQPASRPAGSTRWQPSLGAYFPQPNLTGGGVYNYIAQGNATNQLQQLRHQGGPHAQLEGPPDASAPSGARTPIGIRSSRTVAGPVLRVDQQHSGAAHLHPLHADHHARRCSWRPASTSPAGPTTRSGPTAPTRTGPPKPDSSAAPPTRWPRARPYVTVTGYIPLGPDNDIPKIWSFNNYQYAASTTWIKGRAYASSSAATSCACSTSPATTATPAGRANFLGRFTGDPLADFVLGWADSTRRQLDGSGPYHLISNYSGFLQDDFKVTPSLTLNLGASLRRA